MDIKHYPMLVTVVDARSRRCVIVDIVRHRRSPAELTAEDHAIWQQLAARAWSQPARVSLMLWATMRSADRRDADLMLTYGYLRRRLGIALHR